MPNQGFKGHKDHGQYAGDYIHGYKAASRVARAAANAGGYDFDKMRNYQGKKTVLDAYDSGQVSFDMGLVPDKYKEQVGEWIVNKGTENGRLQIEIEKMRESGNIHNPLYNQLRHKAANIKNILGPNGTMTQLWKDWQNNSAEHVLNKQTGAYSTVSNDADDEALYDSFYSNSLDLQIGEGGTLTFGNSDLGFSNFKELKGLNLTAYKDGQKLLNQFENVYNKHEKLDPNRELFYSNGFHEILREGGTNTILSLAFDPIYNPDEKGGLLRKDEYAQVIEDIKSDDPGVAGKANELLTKALHGSYMDILKNQAQAGYDEKNPAAGAGVDVDTTINDWHAAFTDPSKPPTIQDWRLQVQQFKGRKGTPWDDGFEIARSGDDAGTRTFMVKGQEYDQKTFETDKTYKTLYNMTVAEFNALPKNEKQELAREKGVTTKVSGGSSGGTYIVPNNASMSQANKFSIGYKIDPKLDKDEILRILNALK
jgi:hypothetical protein